MSDQLEPRLSFQQHLHLLAYVEAGSVRVEPSGAITVFGFDADPAQAIALEWLTKGDYVKKATDRYNLTSIGLSHLDRHYPARPKDGFKTPAAVSPDQP